MTLQSELIYLSARAETALNQSRTFLESKLEFINGELVWVDQPDKGPPYLGAYGASCAAIALVAAGAQHDDPLLRQLIEYLCDHQLASGGWTIRNANPVGLTTACAFSLIAIGMCGVQTDKESQTAIKGLDWLIRTAKSNGWPFYEGGDEISVVATALAVKALNQVRPLLPPSGMQVLRQGCHSLENSMMPEGWWAGRINPTSGSVAATSHTMISLIQAGYHVFTEPIVRGSAWLKKQRDWSHDSTDSFFAHGESGLAAHVLYVHFTPALMLQALLECETDIIDDEAVHLLVEHLLESQSKTGEWTSPLAPKQTPSWMEMDGALALSKFITSVSAVKPSLLFREEIILINSNLTIATDGFSKVCEELEARVRRLEETVQHQSRALKLLNPTVAWLSKGFPYLLTFLVVVAYIYVRPYIQKHELTDVAAVIVSAILLILSFVSQRRAGNKEEEVNSLNSVLGTEANKDASLRTSRPLGIEEPSQQSQPSTIVRRIKEMVKQDERR